MTGCGMVAESECRTMIYVYMHVFLCGHVNVDFTLLLYYLYIVCTLCIDIVYLCLFNVSCTKLKIYQNLSVASVIFQKSKWDFKDAYTLFLLG